jgi:Ca-activated chloride channel family protein
MPFELSDFHFIRPMLLWLLIPALLLIYQLKQNAKNQSAWQNVISPHLLKFLFESGGKLGNKQKSRSTLILTTLIVLLSIVAISGPSFRQKSVPVFQTEHAQVILVDLSLSMDATDIKPSRLERAKFKLMDLLNNTKEGTVALIVYAGDAFIISPLTSDANTITSIIPTLSTGIMPVLGSRPDIAIEKSIELLRNAKASHGEVVWLTDGVESEYVDAISSRMKNSPYQLSILAVGTKQGAPIPLPEGNGFLKDSSGTIVVPKLEESNLKNISKQTNAGYVKLTADNSDIEYLQQYQQWQAEADKEINNNEQLISRWIDDGYWLVWAALALFIIKLLRQPSGQLMNVLMPVVSVLFISSLFSQPANALEWADLWQTKDQQAQQAFKNEEFDKAANLFQERQWQAAAQFKNGDFSSAAENFIPEKSTNSLYNHATSLAKNNDLEAALEAYKQLLEKQPDHQDGLFNKKIVEEMLKQQQQDKQNQENNEQDSEQDKKDQESKDSESQDQQQQDSESDEKKEQQSEQEQDQEQKESEQQAEQKQAEISEDEREKSEKDQALEHWLEKIPDDPGGLLRRKMYREYQKRGRVQKEKKLW